MAKYTQDNSQIAVNCDTLGKDALLLTSFSGHEEMSRLFHFQLDMLSEKKSIAATEVVGKKVAFEVQMPDGNPRYFHGHVKTFACTGRGDRLHKYRADIIPWLWFLTQTSDCRIFQKKSVPDIIKQVFADSGFGDYELQVSGSHPPWEYCVQYRETDFNFVSRLMEQEGIFYYFRHEKGKHTLVLADDAGGYDSGIADSEVKFETGVVQPEQDDQIKSWQHQYQFTAGKWVHTDYNFEKPSTDLMADTKSLVKLSDNSKYEYFDYPGEYQEKGDGTSTIKTRMQEGDVQHDIVSGSSICRSFSPGGKFKMGKHFVEAEANKGYALTSVRHSASIGSAYVTGGDTVQLVYQNSFTCIPDAVTFRPARNTPKPVVQGIQTAVVTGKSGEEIWPDKYGRVKVQFHWDREGKKDENTTCWIRVSQPCTGKNWGMVHIPRIGQEVVVSFLEGDPDRPLITGMLYNAETMPPYDLPTDKTQTGIKTRSSKNGAAKNFNELRFEDKKDEEEIYFHAEKDFNRVVENDDTLKVGFDKKDSGDQTIEIFNNQDVTIGCAQAQDGSQTTEIWKDQNTTLKQGNRDVQIEMGNDDLKIKMGNQTTKLDMGKSLTEAMQSIELKVGSNSILIDQTGITIKGLIVTVQGDTTMDIKSPMTNLSGDATLTLKGGMIMIN